MSNLQFNLRSLFIGITVVSVGLFVVLTITRKQARQPQVTFSRWKDPNGDVELLATWRHQNGHTSEIVDKTPFGNADFVSSTLGGRGRSWEAAAIPIDIAVLYREFFDIARAKGFNEESDDIPTAETNGESTTVVLDPSADRRFQASLFGKVDGQIVRD